MIKRTIVALTVTISLLSVALSGCSSAVSPGQSFEVKRGDLDIIVSTNGSLSMPNTFNLRFGTAGKVQTILVQEGAIVKQGALLAFLDNTAQKNAIRTALFNIRSAFNGSGRVQDPTNPNNAITVNTSQLTCLGFDPPNSYPDLSAVQIFQEAQKDLDECVIYFDQGNYLDAGFKLGMAYFDIDVCRDLIAMRVNPAALAGAKVNSVYYPDGTPGSSADMWPNDAAVVDYLEKYQARLLAISQLLMSGVYAQAKGELVAARQEMFTGNQLVENTAHVRGRTMLEYPDIPTSLDFLQLSMRSLQDLDKYLGQGDATQEEIARRLYTARLNLSIGSDVLQNQTLTYDLNSGFNWKSLQQYNLALQSAGIAFYKAKQDIMNTVIIAPSDGIVVSISLKQGAILSAQDYSSRTAITLVDTSIVKFTGMVDEIDIIKVKAKQEAKIKVDAIPNEDFIGTVKFISPFGTKVGQVIKFAVTILFVRRNPELRGGLSATADISAFTAKNVLLIPVSVIISTPSGSIVMVTNESTGEPEPRPVTLGKQSLQFAEVTAGLKEGEKVMVLNQKSTIQGNNQQRPGLPPGMMR